MKFIDAFEVFIYVFEYVSRFINVLFIVIFGRSLMSIILHVKLVDTHVVLLTSFILRASQLLFLMVLNSFSNSFLFVIILITFHEDVLLLVFILNLMLLIHIFTYINSMQN